MSEPHQPKISAPEVPQDIESYDGQPLIATVGDGILTLSDSAITIHCVASGIPEPSITWLKDGQTITQEERFTIYKNGSLRIAGSLVSDSGKFSCVARNRFGENKRTSSIAIVGT